MTIVALKKLLENAGLVVLGMTECASVVFLTVTRQVRSVTKLNRNPSSL